MNIFTNMNCACTLGIRSSVVIHVGPFHGGYGWCVTSSLLRDATRSFICKPGLPGSKVMISFPDANMDIVFCEVLVFGEGTYCGNRVLVQNI